MNLLDSTIEELYQIEPFWRMCAPCQCKGHCCIGADITVYEDEWAEIQRHIETLPEEEKAVLHKNITQKAQCVFRATDKCLIHEVRPENCRYTPFQAVIRDDDVLEYSMVGVNPLTGRCRFRIVEKPLGKELAQQMRRMKFLPLKNFNRTTQYLCLNWQIERIPPCGTCHHVSTWLSSESVTH